MGIAGLLPLLKSIQRPCHLKKFKGQTLGVDAYGWLHRGIIACALELALGRPTRKHINYVLHRVRMLIHFGIKPYLVFDGDNLPSKAKTEAGRRERREQAKKEGLELLNLGKKAQAYKVLQKAVDVTPQMTYDLIQELKKLEVAYVVAPYEADAQLAYLERKGIVNGVLSEDSDLLVFGVQKLLTKLDQYGNCIEVNRNEFSACRDISLIGWTDADFRRMAILSGCDYLESLSKMGLKTAYQLVRRHKSLDKILRMIQFDGTFVPKDYATRFEQAERSFVHHRVFCPDAKGLVLLTGLTGDLNEDEMPYLGTKVDAEIAVLVASGELDPMTKTPICGSKYIQSSENFPLSRAFALGENRRHTFGTTVELKDNKRINSFFKKRMPLAELDPNSLTPSPSQHRLLQRHSNASWIASPSPSPLAQSTQSVSRSGVRRADTEEFLTRAAKASEYVPSKRPRLCSDLQASTANDEVASPFFSTTNASAKKLGKAKKARRSNFGIFSDDSVEDILVQLPEPTQEEGGTAGIELEAGGPDRDSINGESWAKFAAEEKTQIMEAAPQILEDDIDVVPASSPVAETETPVALRTQTSSFKSISRDSNAVSQSTADTSIGPEDDSFVDLLEYHVQNQNAWLAEKFSHKPRTERTSEEKLSRQMQNDVENNVGRSSGGARIESEPPAKTNVRRPIAPLQQLSRSILREMKSLPDLSGRDEDKYQQQPTTGQSSTQVKPSDTYKTISRGPHTIPPNGSEDLIVPSSEDEAGHSSEDDDLPKHRPVLDLERFTFKANKVQI